MHAAWHGAKVLLLERMYIPKKKSSAIRVFQSVKNILAAQLKQIGIYIGQQQRRKAKDHINDHGKWIIP